MKVRVEDELVELGRMRAPRSLYPRVMAAVGLADSYGRLETALGAAFVAWNRDGVNTLRLGSDEEEFERWFVDEYGRPALKVAELPRNLGRRFDLSRLPAFQQAVLKKALEIPAGEVRPYAWIAREIGHPAAVRAVGTALARNPIPILIPCHRVVRSDGVIGDYGAGGPPNKRKILAFEGVDTSELERLARRRVRYRGSRTTHVYCFPTCRHARAVHAGNVVEFSSDADARAAGYRACKDCRPGALSA
jgi:O-6-methylguanine DNA methyltransferase